MIEHFRRLFAYDDWANQQTLAAMQAANPMPARALDRMAHVLSAQYVWFDRLKKQPQTFPVWPAFTLDQCAAEAAKLAALWKGHLSAMGDDALAAEVSYKNTVGESWTSRTDDVFTHVLMHSAYHRGQVASDLRGAGFTPAHTDFILAIRKGLVK